MVATGRGISRRCFLRGAGIALSLPLLEAMLPAFAAASESSAPASSGAKPRRMLAICNNLGLLPEQFFPKGAGRDYTPSPYLELLKEHREEFTVFSGVSHPDVDGGHPADNCFLTAAPHPGRGGFRNTISLDQFIAERIGHLTRFPSLNLGRQRPARAAQSVVDQFRRADSVRGKSLGRLSPHVHAGHARTKWKTRCAGWNLGKSILDAVADQAKDLQRNVGARDRDRLDQYFTSVRELEQRMAMSREWERKPKPARPRLGPLDPASPREYMEKVQADVRHGAAGVRDRFHARRSRCCSTASTRRPSTSKE